MMTTIPEDVRRLAERFGADLACRTAIEAAIMAYRAANGGAAMVERPILFQGPMVRAILDGRKTETRRLASNPHAARIQPGDMLWVREAWARAYVTQAMEEWFVYREADNSTDYGGPWKPSIHMPRAASRILLRVTGVHVEPLQAITEDGARAEGVEQDTDGWRDYQMPTTQCCASAWDSYRTLWNAINPKNPWDSNPSVRVIQFERVRP